METAIPLASHTWNESRAAACPLPQGNVVRLALCEPFAAKLRDVDDVVPSRPANARYYGNVIAMCARQYNRRAAGKDSPRPLIVAPMVMPSTPATATTCSQIGFVMSGPSSSRKMKTPGNLFVFCIDPSIGDATPQPMHRAIEHARKIATAPSAL